MTQRSEHVGVGFTRLWHSEPVHTPLCSPGPPCELTPVQLAPHPKQPWRAVMQVADLEDVDDFIQALAAAGGGVQYLRSANARGRPRLLRGGGRGRPTKSGRALFAMR
jgi:hypothetical protein